MVIVHAHGRLTGQSRSQVGRHGQGAGVNRVVRGHAMEKEVVGLVFHVIVLDGGSTRADLARVW